MRNLFIKKILVTTIFFLVIFLLPQLISAADISPDAIAARVVPNPNHLSPLRWYQANIKNQGSPQSLQVDGYEAVRDGRTVYIDTANISGNNFYTNIYIISYNQNADATTLDIFGQILAHWKFNTNLSSPSDKEKTVRDTKKLADLSEIKIILENYKNKYGYYPKLSAGSYIAGRTVSTWPSWQSTLGKGLGVTLQVDPVNKLGACGGTNYNAITCWDEKSKKFADPNPSDSNFELPAGSSAYVYSVNSSASDYDVCAVMESGYITTLDQGACYGSTSVKIGGSSFNNPPVIICGSLIGSPDKEFRGYVKAYDSDPADTINSWAITSQDVSGWSNLILKSSKVNNQKELYSSKAGAIGDYSFTLEVSDSRGAKTSFICPITIKAVCGDKVVDTQHGEVCDDGVRNGQAGHCNSTCTGWLPGECGNGVKEPPNETCDDGSLNGTANHCNKTCDGITPSYCGNGIKEASEDCDGTDGVAKTPADSLNAVKQYGCTSSRAVNPCKFTGGYCGNGNPEPIESCDSGAARNGTPTFCNATCTGMTTPVCGNGIREGDEICDGTTGTIARIPAESTINKQYGCGLLTCKPDTGGYCGDKTADTSHGEKCDWNNYTVPSAVDSTINNQYACSQAFCQPTGGWCGDGTKNGTQEECDGTGANSGVALTAAESVGGQKQYRCTTDHTCKFAGGYCGDGTKDPLEQCDWNGYIVPTPEQSNINWQYGCSQTCQFEGGYGGDHDTNGTEDCDPTDPATNSKSCTTLYSGLPSYCGINGTIDVLGTDSCGVDYKYQGCVALPPAETGKTSEACNTTSPRMLDYACCEITSCDGDACSCCGRPYNGNPVTPSYTTPTGYSDITRLAPTNKRDGNGNIIGLCNTPTNLSCKLIRGNTNKRDWYIYTDHTFAKFRCWK